MNFVVDILVYFFCCFIDKFVGLFNIISKRIFVPGLILLNWAMLAALTTFVTSLILIIKNLITYIYKFFDVLNATTSQTTGLIGISFSVLKSVGFFQALADAFTSFLPFIALFGSLVVMKVLLYVMKEKLNFYRDVSMISSGADMGKGTFFRKKK